MRENQENYVEPVSYVNKAYVDYSDKNSVSVEAQETPVIKNENSPKILNKEEKRIKWSIIKNVLCVSFSFSLLFTSYNSMSNLQSSIYKQLGTTSQAVVYSGLVISCFFLTNLIMRTLKPKWGICLSMLLYSPYLATLYYPRYYTFIPTAFLLGVAGAPLWTSKCTYLSKIGEKYSEVVGEHFDVVIVRFFGIFFLFLQSSQVWGNLISSAVLSAGVSNFTRSEEFLETCGANFCPDFKLGSEAVSSESTELQANETSQTSLNEASNQQFRIYIMTTIYLLLALAAASFVAFVIDPLSSYGIESSTPTVKAIFATLNHMKNPYQILITPLTLWSGIEQGFLSADYTAAFVTCGIGVHMVGYVLICFGVTDAIFSYAFTPLIKYVKRVPIFTFGAIMNIALIIVLFTWKPRPEDYIIFFLISSLWGMADAVWQTQINAFYGVIFPGETEAAFSNYRLWESGGFIVAYIMSSSLCMKTKLYICLLFLGIGMAGYYTIEILEIKKNKKDSD